MRMPSVLNYYMDDGAGADREGVASQGNHSWVEETRSCAGPIRNTDFWQAFLKVVVYYAYISG